MTTMHDSMPHRRQVPKNWGTTKHGRAFASQRLISEGGSPTVVRSLRDLVEQAGHGDPFAQGVAQALAEHERRAAA